MHKYSLICYWRLTSLLAIKHICDMQWKPACCIFCIFHVCANDHKYIYSQTSHVMWQSIGKQPCSASCTCERTLTHKACIYPPVCWDYTHSSVCKQPVSLYLSPFLFLCHSFPYLIVDWKEAESLEYLFSICLSCVHANQHVCGCLLSLSHTHTHTHTHTLSVTVSCSPSFSRKASPPPTFSCTEKTANHSPRSSIYL